MEEDPAQFSFGKNWKAYLTQLSDESIRGAFEDIDHWIGENNVQNRNVIDIGSGSGLHSYIFHRMGAASIFSFDHDHHCLEATKSLWERAGKPQNWTIQQGSILDDTYLNSLPLKTYDIVYSWGVLHHTGKMWQAINNASKLVTKNGVLMIALYNKGPSFEKHLKSKEQYNYGSGLIKRYIIYKHIFSLMFRRLSEFNNPFRWNTAAERGMNTYYDIIDWYGGLPYEVASVDEIVEFADKNNLTLQKVKTFMKEGMCNIYLLRKSGN